MSQHNYILKIPLLLAITYGQVENNFEVSIPMYTVFEVSIPM